MHLWIILVACISGASNRHCCQFVSQNWWLTDHTCCAVNCSAEASQPVACPYTLNHSTEQCSCCCNTLSIWPQGERELWKPDARGEVLLMPEGKFYPPPAKPCPAHAWPHRRGPSFQRNMTQKLFCLVNLPGTLFFAFDPLGKLNRRKSVQLPWTGGLRVQLPWSPTWLLGGQAGGKIFPVTSVKGPKIFLTPITC